MANSEKHEEPTGLVRAAGYKLVETSLKGNRATNNLQLVLIEQLLLICSS